MKSTTTLIVAALALTVLGCEDPELSEAIADVKTSAPKVCKNYCAEATTCYWNTVTTEGLERDAAFEDAEQECITACAFRAATGVYVIEAEWVDDEYHYDLKEHVPGSRWSKYFKCLWDKTLWECDEWGNLVVNYDSEAACPGWDECYQLLDINMEWEWNPDHDPPHCQPSGDEWIWQAWGY